MLSKRELAKQTKRAAIIDAAERLFFSRGYEQTTTEALCKAAQLSKRTLYSYFSSKEQIYFEIMIRGYEKLLAMIDAEKTGGTVIARLRQMADTLHRFSTAFPDYFTAIFAYENRLEDFQKGVPDASREKCYRLGEQVFQKLVALIQEGQNNGIFRTDVDAVQTSLILWSSFNGVLNTAKIKQHYLNATHAITSEALIDQAFTLITDSIRADSGGTC